LGKLSIDAFAVKRVRDEIVASAVSFMTRDFLVLFEKLFLRVEVYGERRETGGKSQYLYLYLYPVSNLRIGVINFSFWDHLLEQRLLSQSTSVILFANLAVCFPESDPRKSKRVVCQESLNEWQSPRRLSPGSWLHTNVYLGMQRAADRVFQLIPGSHGGSDLQGLSTD
jgi:hypothetical protein